MKSLGICVGASSIKTAILSDDQNRISLIHSSTRPHESNPRLLFASLMEEFQSMDIDYCCLTGRKFRTVINLHSITEPEALEYGMEFLKLDNQLSGKYDAIISMGAENFILYTLDEKHHLSSVQTGNKCASGTGEFFLQQIRRMNLTIDEAIELAEDSDPYKVSGRCSVFCKSDCTHALNKGIPAGRVSAGLCRMIAEKVLDLLEKTSAKRIIAAGGVTRNTILMQILRETIPELYIPGIADVFEAVGSAWYALIRQIPFNSSSKLFVHTNSSFQVLPPLSNAQGKVCFKSIEEKCAQPQDELVVGLDVGSTTTKAIALRVKDCAVVAKTYLRTNGNPVQASRECYRNLCEQLPQKVHISGIGTTGSGRQIAGLHCGTSNIINEIIAHASAAAFFDSGVETIFEIGGQDAKYTYLTNGVATDYAMNEACSAGTGSFLEEASHESLGIEYTAIQGIAIKGKKPPNFNDQCAAFISSDIKTASHEGIGRDDIVAGLVYSICMNYINRVKGQRPVGKKIFMQGGVCYNKAVPLAMANLIGTEIIVPPEPGLMGAFGVALEVKKRIEQDLTNKVSFNLKALSEREVTYGKKFYCAGGAKKCDRGCEINMIIIEGKKYPFGGACNKYYNLVHKTKIDSQEYNHVTFRQNLIFSPPPRAEEKKDSIRVGLCRSFLVNTFYPLYSTYFSQLGARLIMSDGVDQEGIKRKRSSFCFPGEISHGTFSNILKKETDIIFLPSIVELEVANAPFIRREHQCTCLLLQSEPYFLRSSFKDKNPKLLSPIIDFSYGFSSQVKVFEKIAEDLGFSKEKGKEAYLKAVTEFNKRKQIIRETGDKLLDMFTPGSNRIGIVLFGRPYNAFASEANMGIPEKIASRGIHIIPWDCLPYEKESYDPDINWAVGQDILRAARLVSSHPNLFGVYITNFSCGPDSFLLGYFRRIMKTKPSLTLELDSHTADAGVNTRIEAFIDIIERFRNSSSAKKQKSGFTPAFIEMYHGAPVLISTQGKKFQLDHPTVHLLFPSMGRLTSELIASVFKGSGIKASALPVYDQEVLKTGRANTSCKECLPLILTTGGLINHLKNRQKPDENLVYFMPTCGGNCRFTQYNVFLRKYIQDNKIENVALLSLTNENGYAGLKTSDALNVLKSIIITDCMEDIKNALLVLACDSNQAIETFEKQWEKLLELFSSGNSKKLYKILNQIAEELADIPLKYPLSQAKVVSLMGEIFVRRDYFSCKDIISKLAVREIIVRRAPVLEWLMYCDFNVDKGIYEAKFNVKEFLQFRTKTILQKTYEKKIKKILSKSGLYHYEPIDIDTTMKYGNNFFDLRLTGEAILVAGAFFKDILHSMHGAVSIGPFACMPTRVIESVMSSEATIENRDALAGENEKYKNITTLPFLSIETDGSPFPQIVDARLEAFCLQVERVHKLVNENAESKKSDTQQIQGQYSKISIRSDTAKVI